MMNTQELKDVASQVRRDIVRMVHAVQSGHPGGSLGCADFMTALYFEIMEHNTDFKMNGVNEDLFFLSNGHISPLMYSVLARSGYFDVAELSSFRKINSRLQGHPTTHDHLPGIRMASGSLGQGLSVAVGAALTGLYIAFLMKRGKLKSSIGKELSLEQKKLDKFGELAKLKVDQHVDVVVVV